MNEGLSPAQIALLIGYAAAMTGGQLLFKVAALRAAAAASPGERLFAMLANGFFLAAVLLYGALAVLWVWIVSFTPLSRAYIFVAIALRLRLCSGPSFSWNRYSRGSLPESV